MYFGVISIVPHLPPQMYISTARGDIRQPGGRWCLSSFARCSISSAYSVSAGARSIVCAAPLDETGGAFSLADLFLAMWGNLLVARRVGRASARPTMRERWASLTLDPPYEPHVTSYLATAG